MKRYCEKCGRLKPYHKVMLYQNLNEAIQNRKEAIKNKDKWAKEYFEWYISTLKKEIERNNALLEVKDVKSD